MMNKNKSVKRKKSSGKARPAMPVMRAVEISMQQFAKDIEYLKDR